jgi:hypothetical protein
MESEMSAIKFFGEQVGVVDDFGNFVACADYFDYTDLLAITLATGYA